jgi:Hsp20/alpha crystallin family
MSEVAVKKASEQKTNDEKAVTKRSEEGLSRQGRWDASSWWSPSEFFSNPFALMRRFSEEMDRTFGRFLNREASGESFWSPAIEVSQSDGQLKVHADLPGLKPEDVRVEVQDDQLIIQGERKYEHEEKRLLSFRAALWPVLSSHSAAGRS